MAHDEGRLKVVYIEDNPANLDLVARVLESTGRYRVIGALDGRAGLDTVARERPALVLLDLDVPAINGFEIARRLRSSPDLSRTPIAVVTANILAGERQAAFDAGCESFIEKPFDIHELRREVARLVQGAPHPSA